MMISHAIPRRDIRARLDDLHARYNHRQHVELDPLITLYDYPNLPDRELAGLIAACLAYGNVRAILRGIANALDRMDRSPHAYLTTTPPRNIRRDFAGFRYRVTSSEDFTALLIGLRKILKTHGRIETAFAHHLKHDDITAVPAVGGFVDEMVFAAKHPLRHLLPDPARGSACKRLMLYLRWMVRCDAIDPGGWLAISPAQLVVPLDTHMHRIALQLKLTRRKQSNLITALEITKAFARIAPDDPIKYDFALTRPGILREKLALK